VPVGALGDLDRLDDPLLGGHPAHEHEVIRAPPLERRVVEGQAVVDDGPDDIRMNGRLGLADRDLARRVRAEGIARPGQVEPTVPRRDEGPGRGPLERERVPLEMAVDDIELRLAIEDREHRRDHVAAGVTAMTGGSQGVRNGRDERPRHVGVARGEGRHLVAAAGQLPDQLEDDPLRAPVAHRRD
jgi:hypothetical protein